ncbi:type I-E CRISPR-associated protein Cse2/CasB [Alicycliphilus denitrificans]|uniref:type I-E CRISPR-associated protein Cse2/CasB n=1 Tax=Alicycliphilus denitrificans TaxID=179636 RepID=UPI003A803FF8
MSEPSSPYTALASHILHKADPGEKAALARLSPDQPLRPHEIAALSRALLSADLAPETWRPETWRRWALIAHGMALAGHDGAGRLGSQLARAGVAESRVTKLLTARGDAFTQLLPRVLRLLASKDVRPNWYDLGPLVLTQDSAERDGIQEAEQIRLRIAGMYFSEQARKAAA